MPQIEYSTFVSQIFWLFIVFIAIYFVISKLYLPKIKGVIRERMLQINKSIADSEDLAQQAEKVGVLISKEENTVRQEVLKTKSSARKKADKLIEEFSHKSKKEVSELQSEQAEEFAKMIEFLNGEVDSISSQLSEEVVSYFKKKYKLSWS